MTSCTHFSHGRYCGAEPTRPYLPGSRCAEHTPAALAGHDEPGRTVYPKTATSSIEEILTSELKEIIRDAAANHPRALQVEIGPSEVNSRCTQKLVRKLLDWPKVNAGWDPQPSIDGVAFHTWAAEALERANGLQKTIRWLAETRLQITPTLFGNCDGARLEVETNILDVFDWKRSSPSVITKYQTEGLPPEYDGQRHLYGMGFEQLGYTVRSCAVVFIPRGGHLDDMWITSEPYNRAKAQAALDRMETTRQAIIAVDPEKNPAMWSVFPKAAGHHCLYCDWYLPGTTDLARGCPSEPDAVHPRAPLEDLIALGSRLSTNRTQRTQRTHRTQETLTERQHSNVRSGHVLRQPGRRRLLDVRRHTEREVPHRRHLRLRGDRP